MSEFLDFLKKEEVKKFIFDHLNTSPQKLILNPPKQFRERIKLIADQVSSRQKGKGKLSSWVENLDLIMPPPLSIEQASSESTSIYKSQMISGKHLIDLTGGMGIDCLALGQQFDQVTYIEQQEELCELFHHNCTVLRKDVNVINEKAENALQSMKSDTGSKTFFIDPARRDDTKNRVFKLEDCSPNLKTLLPVIQSLATQVLVKLSPLIDIRSILEEFDHIKEIHVVSVKNDCKELLILIDFSYDDEATIKAVNLETEQPEYHFRLSEETSGTNQYGEHEGYVLEPNSSVLKSGAFKKVGIDFKLKKLQKHTHLYTSNNTVENFPGRIFQVISDADKKNIREYARNGCLNVLTRNYPIKPDVLKKKWKLKDGSDYFLIGFRDLNEKSKLVLAKRVL